MGDEDKNKGMHINKQNEGGNDGKKAQTAASVGCQMTNKQQKQHLGCFGKKCITFIHLNYIISSFQSQFCRIIYDTFY